MKYIILVLLFFSLSAQAHQADVSTTMLVERENGEWILQISAALSAFEYEIKENYPNQEYKTPEEFKEMVINHLRNNLSFVFNDGQKLQLNKAHVSLGHETKVVFEVSGVPVNINNVIAKNTAFNGIYKNQNSLLLFKNGFDKDVFTLSDTNKHSISLKAEGNKFTEVKTIKAEKEYGAFYAIGCIVILLGIGNYLWMSYKQDTTTLISSKF